MKLLRPTDFRSTKKLKLWWDLTIIAQSLAACVRSTDCPNKIKAVKATVTGFTVLLWLVEDGHWLFTAQFLLLAQLQP